MSQVSEWYPASVPSAELVRGCINEFVRKGTLRHAGFSPQPTHLAQFAALCVYTRSVLPYVAVVGVMDWVS